MSEDIELIYNGEDRPSKACFEPITNTKYSKPDGGLWTSPLNKSNGKSAWQSWCEREDFHPERYQTQWHIVPDKDAKTLIADENLENIEPYLINDKQTCPRIDFEKLSQDYDVVRFPQDVVFKYNMGILNAYDIDSTIFLTPKFTAMNDREYQNYKTKEALEIELQRHVAARKEMLAEREEYLRSLQQPQENTPQEAHVEIEQSVRAASQSQENTVKETTTEIKEREHVAQPSQENMSQEPSPKKKNNLFNKIVKQKLWNKIFSR